MSIAPKPYGPSRGGLTLVEILISLALSIVVMLVAASAFRAATKSIAAANQRALEDRLLRAAFLAACDEVDHWYAYDDPHAAAGQTHRGPGEPFAPLRSGDGFDADLAAWLPHRAEAWSQLGMRWDARLVDHSLLAHRAMAPLPVVAGDAAEDRAWQAEAQALLHTRLGLFGHIDYLPAGAAIGWYDAARVPGAAFATLTADPGSPATLGVYDQDARESRDWQTEWTRWKTCLRVGRYQDDWRYVLLGKRPAVLTPSLAGSGTGTALSGRHLLGLKHSLNVIDGHLRAAYSSADPEPYVVAIEPRPGWRRDAAVPGDAHTRLINAHATLEDQANEGRFGATSPALASRALHLPEVRLAVLRSTGAEGRRSEVVIRLINATSGRLEVLRFPLVGTTLRGARMQRALDGG